ncbi:hypothetical protein Ahy_B07g088966 isoform C [Arachis hypogaea]|uniref:Uncharacterized protein n=1 Tax=Arachis hypogaea TaxID=3818 RepID=A0A444YG32_ARAHY|nr:hypothetical protein Ahy_B07g088966 isoform C [Arachis hypogaea]
MTPSPATRLLCFSFRLSATSLPRSASTTRHSPHHRIQSSAPLTTAKKHVHVASSSLLAPGLPLLCSTLVALSLQVQGPAVQSRIGCACAAGIVAEGLSH